MGAHFFAVELDNAIRFSNLSRMSWFLYHISKWTCQFSRFLQSTSEMKCKHVALTPTLTMWLLCSNYGLPWTAKFLGVFSKIDAMQLQQCSLLDLRPTAEFSGKMHKFLSSLAEYPVVLAFLCCHIFDSYFTCLTLTFNTVHVSFHLY